MEAKRISKGIIIVMMGLFFLIITSPVYAIQRMGYILDEEGKKIPSPLSYTFHKAIDGADYKCGSFADPRDIFIDKKGNLFVADTGNDRILKFDRFGNFIRAFGSEEKFNEPNGVFVDEEGNLYVADTGNSRILKFDADGHLLKEYKKPTSPLFGGGYFIPVKLAVDAREYLYVLDRGTMQGLILLDGEGSFRGFFASVRLGFSLTRLLFQLFATKEQKEDARTRRNPRSYYSIDIDDSGFIYAVLRYLDKDQIKKISPVGINVYPIKRFYGEIQVEEWRRVLPQFVDVAVDELGIISVLDASSGKVYQYDQEGNLLVILGGWGEQKDISEYRISIATDKGGALYVLDNTKAIIEVFHPTKLTQLIHQAAKLHFEGKYYEAENIWREVARKNSNFALAHTGLGKALLKHGHYLEAMEEFKYAKDKGGFSKTFKEYRHVWLRKHFGWVALWVLLGIGTLVLLSKLIPKLLNKYGEKTGSFLKTFGSLFKILINPQETLDEVKKANLFSALLFVLLYFSISYLSLLLTSFHFSTFDPERTSFFMESLKFFLPWITWVFASYGVSIIFDGEGTFSSIYISSALCLSPYIIFSVPLSLLSRILVLEQQGYYNFLKYLIYAWIMFLFFFQVKVVHKFSAKKALGVSLLNIAGIGILWVGVVLIYALTYQIFDFVNQIVLEISILGY